MIEKRTFGGIVADIIIWIIVGALALSCLMPLMNIVAISLSDNAAVSANLVNIFPIGFNISSYQEIMGDKQFWRSFGISVLRVVLGLSVNITLLVLTAYPLSKSPKFFTGQKVYMSLILFAMLFSGGLIPTFMVVNSLKLTNTIWALILPGAVPLGNVILLMNAFRGVPKSLEEAAMIDGCGTVRLFFSVVLPMLKPILATVAVLNALWIWNDFLLPYLILAKPVTIPLSQMYFYGQYNQQWNLIMAGFVVSTIPVVLFFLLMQKHIINGIAAGAVKG